jgi:hypothetical protein
MEARPKKLQTTITDATTTLAEGPNHGDDWEYRMYQAALHDARLAHELLAVVRGLNEGLRAAMDYIRAIPADMALPAMPGFDHEAMVDEPLASAAAFLEA